MSCPARWVQEAPKARGRACPQVHSARGPSSAPLSASIPFPPGHPPHSPDLPAPRRPRMARLTSRGALCCPLPARGFPNTEDMATLRRGTRVLGPRAPSSLPAPSGPSGGDSQAPLALATRPRRSPRPPGTARAERAGFPRLGPRGVGGGAGGASGRGCPELRQTPCKGCGSTPRGALTPQTTRGRARNRPRTPPCLASRAGGLLSLSGAPHTRPGRARTRESEALGREIER